MSPVSITVQRRVAFTRLVLGFAVVAFGLMLMATGTLALIHLALWNEPWLGSRFVLASIVPAAVMTWSGLVAFFGIAVPLVHWASREGFLRQLQRVLGRESHAELALELADTHELTTAASAARSPELEEWVAEKALEDLRAVRWTRWRPVARLQWMFPIFVVAVGLTLGLLMEEWAEVRRRVETLVVEPVLSGGVRKHGAGTKVVAQGGEQKAQLPCRTLTVLVSPPAYTTMRPFEVPWGLTTRVVTGSQLEVVCQPSSPNAMPKLRVAGVKESDAGETREAVVESVETGITLRWREEVEQSKVLTVHVPSGASQPGRLVALVTPDRPPACQLIAPDTDLDAVPGDSVRLSLRAEDDLGLQSVTLRYQVEGLDSVPQAMELARPQGEREAVVRKDLGLGALGAEAGDVLLLYIEAHDTNTRNGPSLCTSARHRIRVATPGMDMEEMVRRMAEARDEAIDLLAHVSAAAGAKEEAPEAMEALLDQVARYGGALSVVAQQMEHSGQLKGEDIRRVSGLAVSVDGRLSQVVGEKSAYLRRQALGELVNELQAQAWVLDGLADKLLREYLFHLSGRLQAEMNRVQTVGREPTLDQAGREAFNRGLRKMQRLASRLQEFSDAIRAKVPTLFHPILEAAEKDRLAQIAELAMTLTSGGGAQSSRFKEELDRLSVAVEALAQNMEGAYAQSVNRLSVSFRAAQAELVESVQKMMKEAGELRAGLDSLLKELETETQQYFRRSGAMESVQRLAQDIKELAKAARKIRTEVFVPVDRKQVAQFLDGLKRLAERLSLLRLDDALAQVDELVSLAQSMDFSLQISVDYSQEPSRVEECRKEQAQVGAFRRQLEELEGRIEMLKPERDALRALEPERLQALALMLDSLLAESQRIKERVGGQQKMFPIFFDRLVPMAERVSEALGQAKEKWTSLLFEESAQMLVYTDEALARLLDLLQRVPTEGGASSVLQAGGTVPRLDLQGKGRVREMEKLKTFLEMAPRVSERSEWRDLVNAYYQQLSQ